MNTPEQMAARLYVRGSTSYEVAVVAIRADREARLTDACDSGANESPQDVAMRVLPMRFDEGTDRERQAIVFGVTADREHLAAWCIGKAAEADREAEAHDAQLASIPVDDHVRVATKRERMARCEGQAVAFRGVAAKLGTRA